MGEYLLELGAMWTIHPTGKDQLVMTMMYMEDSRSMCQVNGHISVVSPANPLQVGTMMETKTLTRVPES